MALLKYYAQIFKTLHIVANKDRGFVWGTGQKKTITPIHTSFEIELCQEVQPPHIDIVLKRLAEKLFNYVSGATATISFGQMADSVFNQYQRSVEKGLINLGIENDLKTVYQNLSQDNTASWQASVICCRNIMRKLSDLLWQTNDATYPLLLSGKGEPLNIARDRERNRIRAYLHQKGLKGDDMVARMIDPLYAMCSAGKSEISHPHATSVMIHTYIFVGEMIRLTDMKPVTQIAAK